MTTPLKNKLKPELLELDFEEIDNIPLFLNKDFISGDNEKFMKMYNWMSYGYDFFEKVVGKLKYGKSIQLVRQYLMNNIEWKNNASVLYISIGTGTDLNYIPPSINPLTLDFVGVDISIGMLKKCKKRFSKKLNLSLVNCCGEDLPFKDNQFDIVFHVGGINFFNDKKAAIAEMLRVAKDGTKIMLADETSDYINSEYKKSAFSKKYFKDKAFDLTALENSIPSNVRDKKMEFIWDNKFYCITFRK